VRFLVSAATVVFMAAFIACGSGDNAATQTANGIAPVC
jgi:hypothetical protein